MPLITLIVPIYNSENYIKQCIESVIDQDYSKWELLLVDDGSTDASAEICNIYAKAERRIRLIKKENGGVSSARNMGLNQARGEYISFIDADDYIDKDYCSLLLKDIRPDIGMIILGMRKLFMDGTMKTVGHRMKGGEYSFDMIAGSVIDDGTLSGFTFHSACSVLYRRELIERNNLKFDETIKFNEDGLFNAEYILNCKTHIIVDYQCAPYIYRHNSESASHTMDVMSDLYNRNMTAIEEKLKIFAANIPEADIIGQLKARRAAQTLDKLIYLAQRNMLSSITARDIVKDNINFNILWKLNRKMNIKKKCLCITIFGRQYLLLSVILKKVYAK